MCSAVEVQNASSVVFDDEEAIQSLEHHSGDGEEVKGRDDLAMVV